jgi:hypothetical protein
MKNFLNKITLFVVLSFILQLLIFELIFSPNGSPKLSLYFHSNFSWLSIYSRVQSSYKHTSHEYIVLNKKSFSTSDRYLTTNGAVLPAGNYILCNNAIKNNPRLKYIIYLSVPGVIGHKFERSRTCNNFVKPFYEVSNLNLFDAPTTDKILSSKLNMLYLLKLYKCLPIDEFNYHDDSEKNKFEMSGFSLQYLVKIRDLCSRNGIELIVLSSPIPRSRYNDFKVVESEMRKQIAEAGLEKQFRYYFKELQYYPDFYYRDGLHFTKKHLSVKSKEQKRILAIAARAYSEAKNRQITNTSFK